MNALAWQFVKQPICESRSLEIHHYELLLRNVDDFSAHGPVIEDAELKGFVPVIDFYALTSAIESLEKAELARLAINVSSHTIDHLAAEFLSRMPPGKQIISRLIVEMTETRNPNFEKTVSFRRQLAAIGAEFSIDDFGPGHGFSHAQILQLAPDEIKLSGAALDIAMSGDCEWIEMAQACGCRVVAECIDSAGKLSFVRKHDLDLVQGFIINHR